MRSSSLPEMECPVARSLAEVGDAWSVLIIRDALLGFRRFDEFAGDLGIAPNILTQRLGALVEAGLLERRPYQERPLRHEYIPTAKAREFSLVIAALAKWGTRWLSPEGPRIQLVDRKTGEPLEAAIVESMTAKAVMLEDVQFTAGPQAGPETLTRAARLKARQENTR